jgi:hypothetical protein
MGAVSTKPEASTNSRPIPLSGLPGIFDDSASHLRGKVVGIYGILLVFNVQVAALGRD